MRKRDLEKFRKLLETKRRELVEKATRTAGEGQATVAEGGEDYIDSAVTHYTREFLLSMSDRDRKDLILVEEALVRIREGTYGLCLMSGEPIDRKRLEAIPWARYSRECQEIAEREELAQVIHARDFATEEEE